MTQVQIVDAAAARERRDARLNVAFVSAIVAAAGLLRFWGLNAGVPYNISVDEPQVLNRAVGMMRSGDLNPRFYDYPALYIYMQMVVACFRFMTGALLGYWDSLGAAPISAFYVWGRALTAALGTATVFIVYRIGLRWGSRQALLAAGLMAVMPLHVRESHFVLTDVPVTFFVALTALFSLRALERPSLRSFAIAGGFAGLAAATKYPGALALVMPLIAAAGCGGIRGSRVKVSLGVLSASGAAFLIAAPYTLLDLTGFLNGYARLMGSYTGSLGHEPWQVYTKHLRRAMGWPAFVAMLAGCVLAARRGFEKGARLKWILVLVFPLLYFWFISRQSLVFGRYLMPLVPFAALLAAFPVVAAAGFVRRRLRVRWISTAVVVVLTALTTVPAADDAVRFNMGQSKRTTAALAHDWLIENVPAGTSIYYEGSDLSLAHAPFDSHTIPQLRLRPYEYYVERGVEYLIASSQRYAEVVPAEEFAGDRGGYLRLFELTEEVARFTPTKDHPGPELRILRIKNDQRPGR